MIVLNVESELPPFGKEKVQIPMVLSNPPSTRRQLNIYESPSESTLASTNSNSHGVIILNIERELPHLGKEKVQIPVVLSNPPSTRRQLNVNEPLLKSTSTSNSNSHSVIVLNVESKLPYLGEEKVQVPVVLSNLPNTRR